MREITIMTFRKSPGEFIHEVSRHGKTFIITKQGKAVARLCPMDDMNVINSDGEIIGEKPVTFRNTSLLEPRQ